MSLSTHISIGASHRRGRVAGKENGEPEWQALVGCSCRSCRPGAVSGAMNPWCTVSWDVPFISQLLSVPSTTVGREAGFVAFSGASVTCAAVEGDGSAVDAVEKRGKVTATAALVPSVSPSGVAAVKAAAEREAATVVLGADVTGAAC